MLFEMYVYYLTPWAREKEGNLERERGKRERVGLDYDDFLTGKSQGHSMLARGLHVLRMNHNYTFHLSIYLYLVFLLDL